MGIQRGLAAAAFVAVALSACSRSEAKPSAATSATGASASTTAAAPSTTPPPTTTTAPAAVRPQSAPTSFTDPKDVNLALDIKTVSHSNDATTITYTVETYDPFRDDQADFIWGLDTNSDNKVDTLVGVEYEDGKLEAKVETPDEKELGPAAVTRTGPNSLRVSFSRRFVGSAASYQYRVTAVTDLNHNDEADPGETDVAPDAGFYTHRL
jgi:hypothetical protein